MPTDGTRDAAGRQSILPRTYRNPAGRFFVTNAVWRNAAGRVRVATTGWRTPQGRFRLRAQSGRDAAGRASIKFPSYRDAAGRAARVRATQWQDGYGRFSLTRRETFTGAPGRAQLVSRRIRDSALGRFRMVYGGLRDASGRILLLPQYGDRIRDVYGRFNVYGQPTTDGYRDGIGRASVSQMPAGFAIRPVAPSWSVWAPSPASPYTFFFELLESPGVSAGVFPLTEVKFSITINQAATFQAKLPLSDSRLVPDTARALAATAPEHGVVYIDRGGQLVAPPYSILTREHDLETDTLSLGGQDLFYWLSRRAITDDLSFTNEDQLQIQRDLLAYTQAKPNGDLGISADPTVTSGVLLYRPYLAAQGTNAAGAGTQDSSNIATAMTNIANLDPGFEFRMAALRGDQGFQRVLRQAFPYFGVTASQTTLRWRFPSDAIKSFTWPEDGTTTARKVYELGNQDSANTRPVGESSEDPGFPLTELVESYSVDDQASLDAYADAQQKLRRDPEVLPTMTVHGHYFPEFGTYHVGDHARLVVEAGRTGRWPDGMDSVWRIVQMDVTVTADGHEDVQFTFAKAKA